MTDQDKDRQDNASESGASSVRQRAIEAYDEAREGVAEAGRKANDAIDEAPLIVLAGGLAVGAILAALLPRTESETRALRPVSDKLADTAKAAAAAAKDAGKSRLAELGLTKEKGTETLRSIFESAGDAAKTSAQAALSAARTRE